MCIVCICPWSLRFRCVTKWLASPGQDGSWMLVSCCLWKLFLACTSMTCNMHLVCIHCLVKAGCNAAGDLRQWTKQQDHSLRTGRLQGGCQVLHGRALPARANLPLPHACKCTAVHMRQSLSAAPTPASLRACLHASSCTAPQPTTGSPGEKIYGIAFVSFPAAHCSLFPSWAQPWHRWRWGTCMSL